MYGFEDFDDSVPDNVPKIKVLIKETHNKYHMYFDIFPYKHGDIVVRSYNTAKERFFRVKHNFFHKIMLKNPVLEQIQPKFY